MARRLWPSNKRTVTVDTFGPNPVSVAQMGGLHQAISLVSPMARGRARYGLPGVGANRDDRDIGALQDFRGQALVARRMDQLRAGTQGGPGDAPAYPSTGSSRTAGIMSSLAGMDLPEVLR